MARTEESRSAFVPCREAGRVCGGRVPPGLAESSWKWGKCMTQVESFAVDELVREIARALVDEPEAVEVDSVDRDENTVLRLRVAPNDVGKVIGKQGRTARSVRTILGAVSMKLHHRYTLDILEEDDDQE